MKKISQFLLVAMFSMHIVSYAQTQHIREFKLNKTFCTPQVYSSKLSKSQFVFNNPQSEEVVFSTHPMVVKGLPVRFGESIFFQINFYHGNKIVTNYVNEEEFANIGDVYETTTKNHKYLLVEFIQEYATSYWLFRENLKKPNVALILKNMYLREDDNIEVEKQLERGKEYWIKETKKGLTLFFKRGEKSQCKRISVYSE